MVDYGYARISKKKQNIERQIRNIKAEYPAAIIVQEAYTGTKINRKEWNKLYKTVKAGDRIIFDNSWICFARTEKRSNKRFSSTGNPLPAQWASGRASHFT